MNAFPHGFLWGAATSAYQVEGNNTASDWWQWEKQTGKKLSAAACRHYELYEQDFNLAQSLNHNTHRLSIEWSRIEPQEGKFCEKELQHYVKVIRALKDRSIEPVVTLHHFTNPAWLTRAKGWETKRCIDLFARYCDRVVAVLAPMVRYWITINEPTIYLSHAYLFGAWPPQEKSLCKAMVVQNNLAAGHIKAYALIHCVYKRLNLPVPLVSFSQYTQAFLPCRKNALDRFASRMRNKWFNLGLLQRCLRHKAMDFIGINYYSRQLVDVKGWGLRSMLSDVCQSNHQPVEKNSLGWDIYPEGLYDILLQLKGYNLPVIITENGICTQDDALRWKFIVGHLNAVHRAMEKGVDVRGYLYWSLIDNFEWDKGFGPRFGLIDIDYATQKRTVRESARKFAEVCRTGVLRE